MSYNLYASGHLDYVTLSRTAERLKSLELFPIIGDDGPDALGIALPSKRVNETARDELGDLIAHLHVIGARVHDLCAGLPIETPDDLDALFERIFGS